MFMAHAKKSANILIITKSFSKVYLSILHTLANIVRVEILVVEPNSG